MLFLTCGSGRLVSSSAYDPLAFRAWASREACPGIHPVLGLFTTLLDKGFKVFLLSGRDEETLGSCTAANLEAQGFSGYERLIMRCTLHTYIQLPPLGLSLVQTVRTSRALEHVVLSDVDG
jgi:hypothetical protein